MAARGRCRLCSWLGRVLLGRVLLGVSFLGVSPEERSGRKGSSEQVLLGLQALVLGTASRVTPDGAWTSSQAACAGLPVPAAKAAYCGRAGGRDHRVRTAGPGRGPRPAPPSR
ncbi:hypothetical protein NN561_020280 [Cricetulus griseus]